MSHDVPAREPRIEEAGPLRYLLSGEMIHGAQYLQGPRTGIPVPYFPAPGPAAELVEAARRTAVPGAPRIGVVGLGTGGLAAHAESGESIVFFEHDERVVEFARRTFTYLEDSPASTRVVVGEGRESLADCSAGPFDLLVVDAFVGDAIPSHIVTVEAVELYLDRLADGGMVAFHVSNKFVDLPAILGNAADAVGLVARRRSFDPRGDDRFADLFVERSRWVVLREGRVGDEVLADWERTPPDDEHPLLRDARAREMPVLR